MCGKIRTNGEDFYAELLVCTWGEFFELCWSPSAINHYRISHINAFNVALYPLSCSSYYTQTEMSSQQLTFNVLGGGGVA